ncbi:MAG: glycosyltransferase [Xenococcaceae cyanobacterium MO_188.B32]|nr:glycosyltransferase [Xenococcaceae cyanobacterium MO_188.B32]
MSPTPPFASVSEFIQILTNRKLDYANSFVSDPPAVSIISSFYNVPEEYFRQANYSIAHQTFQNYEWIIVDDCSTESEAKKLFDFLPQLNPKIKTLRHQKNRGLAAGRNTAITNARGKYLLFMDTDDILEPTFIEKCVIFLETHPEFSFVNSYSVGFQAQEYWWTNGFDRPSKFIEQNWVTGRLLYKKEDFDRLGQFDEKLRFYEDWEMWLKAFSHHQKGWTIPEFLDCYRRSNSGLLAISRQRIAEEQQVTNLIKSRYQKFFEENNLADIYIERPMFDVSVLRQKIEIKNSLYLHKNGKRVLCWLPHMEVGGADKFNLDLFAGLKQRGYDLTIVTTVPAQNLWQAKFYQITPDIFHLPGFLHYGHWLTFARYLIESRQIDIVFISNAYYAYYLVPILRQEFPQVAFVDYTHTEDPNWREGGYPRVSCQFTDFLDCQIVTSAYLANYYQQLAPKTQNKLRVCYINVDKHKWQFSSQKRREYRQKLAINDNIILLIFPARITQQKRPLFLVEIIKKLSQKSLPIAILTLGKGDMFAEFNNKINSLGLSSVFKLLSHVSPEEMVGYYSAADILLLPSEYEGISLAIYEAMAMGLPIIASDVGGQKELLTPGSGFLIPKTSGDLTEIEKYVEVLESLINDRKRRQQIGKSARARVEKHFSLEITLDRIETIFDEAKKLRITSFKNKINSAISEEMLLWIQEYLALDRFWHESQKSSQRLKELNAWNNHLQKDTDMFKNQSIAWKKVARQMQKELEQLKTQYHQAQANIKALVFQLKNADLSSSNESVIDSFLS